MQPSWGLTSCKQIIYVMRGASPHSSVKINMHGTGLRSTKPDGGTFEGLTVCSMDYLVVMWMDSRAGSRIILGKGL